MKNKICNYLAGVIEDVNYEELVNIVETPPEENMGDLAILCFSFAKKLHKNPAIIAQDIKNELDKALDENGIDHVEAVGAYCNVFLSREAYVKKCIEKLMDENNGVAKTGAGKNVCMDYSSPNIAKNFHVGHLRTTVIGNSLYKIHEKLGYKVIRMNHLGDWGTQFGKLIVAYKLWSSKEQVEEKGIDELLRIYVKFNQEAEQKPELMDEARAWFVKMEKNDEEALAIWNWFKDISMIEFERVYKLLDISFDYYLGESFYRDQVPALVEILKEKKLLIESQGANVVDLSEYDMPPCMITKNDGGSIYHSRDLAAILYRKEKFDFEKCLYVTGLEQTLHFKQIFKTIELMGYDFVDGLVHVPYGLVSLAGGKLSTRNGNIIYAEDILKEAIERAYKAIEEKNPQLNDKEDVASMVGVGAVIFHDLFNQRIKNVDFSWDDVLGFEGTTGPYVQYTCARAKSILRKCDAGFEYGNDNSVIFNKLTDDSAYALIKTLSEYEDVVNEAALRYEPSVVARFVIRVATAFNKFYHECPILKADAEERDARLLLVKITEEVITDACGLLGIKCPDEM